MPVPNRGARAEWRGESQKLFDLPALTIVTLLCGLMFALSGYDRVFETRWVRRIDGMVRCIWKGKWKNQRQGC